MMKKILSAMVLVAASMQIQAQPDEGMKVLENLCGCFSVNFKYAETFSPNSDYKFHDREEMSATELALPIEKTDKKLVIQHLLVINDTMIIKHWREEWLYESPVVYEYAGNMVWNRKELPAAEVKNKWTQTVWEVSDQPRYQGVSTWIKNNGETYWESTAFAPLPRREYSVRSDYNILKRRNRILLTEDGYLHEQDNGKIIRAEAGDQLLAQEKGYNTYIRMDDEECKAAKDWWKNNAPFWKVVRDEWSSYLDNQTTVALNERVDDKLMHSYLFALWADWKSNKVKPSELDAKVKEVMQKFTIGM